MAGCRRRIAEGVVEQHQRRCSLSAGGTRCSCEPTYLARVKRDGREHSQGFPSPEAAVAWQRTTGAALDGGGSAARRVRAPRLEDVAVSFLHRARRGEALTRSRSRYALATIESYERTLRLHVLDATDHATGLRLGELPADAIGGRTLQVLADELAVRTSGAVGRVALSALDAVLRDGYLRGFRDDLPPRVVLPPAPKPRRERTLTLPELERVRAATFADDEARGRSLMVPLVELLADTGGRIGEVLGLDWGPAGLDLEHEPPVARIRRETTKTDAGARTIPLSSETARALRRHRLATGRPADGLPVFADERGRRLARSGRVRAALARIGETAELGFPLSPHVFRRTATTELVGAGVAPAVAARRLGHADGGVLLHRVYARPGELEQVEALRAVEKLRSARRRTHGGPKRRLRSA